MKPAKAPLAAPEIPPSIGASGLKGLTRNLGEPAPTKAPGFSAKTPYLGLVDSVYPVFNCDINESSMSASAVVPRKSADLTKSATDHAIRPFILLVMVGRCMPRKAARALCDLFCAVKSILTFQAITDSAYCTSVSTFFLAVAGADVVIVGPLLFMFLTSVSIDLRFVKGNAILLVMKKPEQNAKGTSGMKEWLKAQGISYRRLAASMGSSAATVCKKLNGETPWQQRDLLFFHDKFGLSSDFVLGISTDAQEEEVL